MLLLFRNAHFPRPFSTVRKGAHLRDDTLRRRVQRIQAITAGERFNGSERFRVHKLLRDSDARNRGATNRPRT